MLIRINSQIHVKCNARLEKKIKRRPNTYARMYQQHSLIQTRLNKGKQVVRIVITMYKLISERYKDTRDGRGKEFSLNCIVSEKI